MSAHSAEKARRIVHLNGDRHDTAVTERYGLFSVYCGCGWKAQDLPFDDALAAESAHTSEVQA